MCDENIKYEIDDEGYISYYKITEAPSTGCIICRLKVGILKMFGKDKILCLRKKIEKK
jgi:hypothetical protein